MSVAREYMTDTLLKYGWSKSERESSAYQRFNVEHEVPHIKKIPLRNFISDHEAVVSDKPVLVIVAFEEGQYYATNETLDLFGVGDSITAAIEDLSHHIVHFYKYYSNIDLAELSGRAIELKNIYQNFALHN